MSSGVLSGVVGFFVGWWGAVKGLRSLGLWGSGASRVWRHERLFVGFRGLKV